MIKKVLITGISGFAGSYLGEHLLSKKDLDLHGTYLAENSLSSITDIRNKIQLNKIDLLEKDHVEGLIDKIKPDLVFHLAALTSPSDSFKHPAEVITNNITAQINLLEALRVNNLQKTKILIVSSADVYGRVDKKDLPIDEETRFIPTSPYSVSKIAQDFLGLQYFLSFKLQIVRVRPFNHIGPRQSPGFVVSDFAKKIAEIEKGKTEPILRVGNLEAKRDFTDVRDVVLAYDLLLEKGKAGDVYNVGSGIAYKISSLLEYLLSFAKIKIRVEVDKSLLRPIDTPELRCNNEKFSKLTGWQPAIPLEQTLKDTLDYWRSLV